MRRWIRKKKMPSTRYTATTYISYLIRIDSKTGPPLREAAPQNPLPPNPYQVHDAARLFEILLGWYNISRTSQGVGKLSQLYTRYYLLFVWIV